MVLPVQKSHLRESGIGKLVVAMAADPGETRDNRELIKQARISGFRGGELGRRGPMCGLFI